MLSVNLLPLSFVPCLTSWRCFNFHWTIPSLRVPPHPSPGFYPEVRTQCAHLEVIPTAKELPVGRATRLKMHCTLYVYICVCMCASRVSCDPTDSQLLLITNSWRALVSTNQASC